MIIFNKKTLLIIFIIFFLINIFLILKRREFNFNHFKYFFKNENYQEINKHINGDAIDSFIFNNAILTQSGTYYDTLIGSNDCDSIITLNLTLEFTGLSIQDFNDIKIYPNPTNGLIFIECSNFERAEITDLCGKKIMSLKSKEIDLSELASGFYCLKIINTMLQEHTETIIKQ